MSAADRDERFYAWAEKSAPGRRKGYAIHLHKVAADKQRTARSCVRCGSDGGKAGIGCDLRMCVPCELAERGS